MSYIQKETYSLYIYKGSVVHPDTGISNKMQKGMSYIQKETYSLYIYKVL